MTIKPGVEMALRSILQPIMSQAWSKSKKSALASLTRVIVNNEGGCRLSPLVREARGWISDNRDMIRRVIALVSQHDRKKDADWGTDLVVKEWRASSDELPHQSSAA